MKRVATSGPFHFWARLLAAFGDLRASFVRAFQLSQNHLGDAHRDVFSIFIHDSRAIKPLELLLDDELLVFSLWREIHADVAAALFKFRMIKTKFHAAPQHIARSCDAFQGAQRPK